MARHRKKTPISELPKGELLCVQYHSAKGELLYVLTSDAFRQRFTLYSYSDGNYTEVESGDNPLELEQKHSIHKNMMEKS